MTLIYVWSLATVAFALELVMVLVLGYAGWVAASGGAMGWLVGAGVAVVVAIVWGLFAAPQSTFDVPVLAVTVKVVLFAAAAIVIWRVAGRGDLAVAFAVVALAANVAALFPPYRNYGGFNV